MDVLFDIAISCTPFGLVVMFSAVSSLRLELRRTTGVAEFASIFTVSPSCGREDNRDERRRTGDGISFLLLEVVVVDLRFVTARF